MSELFMVPVLFGAAICFILGGYIGGCIAIARSPAAPAPAEWKTWFRYFLDIRGVQGIARSAEDADEVMAEINKRRKG